MKDLSIIIPAYNEEGSIVETLETIKENIPVKYSYEIIVIDHFSSDRTSEIAQNAGANVLRYDGASVADLRNFGAARASGQIIIFLDADVHLTPTWKKNIESVIDEISNGVRKLTGSWVSVPEHSSWIEQYWFEPQQRKENTHINSGHMIIKKTLFEELGGFDVNLETGEDYEISMRAKRNGVEVTEEPLLKVIHEGYPKTLSDYFKREVWHGKGDAVSLKAIFSSKVAILSAIFILLHIALLFELLYFHAHHATIYVTCIGIVLIPFISSWVKFNKEKIFTRIINSFLFYVYFFARGISLLNRLIHKKSQKRHR
ncbi:MAG: glycosyltransferase [Gammaproteobacteria bacterium]|nr:glycosyltransferase [Gammaproteobacteria bacterium]